MGAPLGGALLEEEQRPTLRLHGSDGPATTGIAPACRRGRRVPWAGPGASRAGRKPGRAQAGPGAGRAGRRPGRAGRPLHQSVHRAVELGVTHGPGRRRLGRSGGRPRRVPIRARAGPTGARPGAGRPGSPRGGGPAGAHRPGPGRPARTRTGMGPGGGCQCACLSESVGSASDSESSRRQARPGSPGRGRAGAARRWGPSAAAACPASRVLPNRTRSPLASRPGAVVFGGK
jgi:translation initiation factor IF-2